MNDDQKHQLKQFLSNVSALLEAMRYSTTSASGEYANMGRYGSYKMFLRKYETLAKQAAPLLANATILDRIHLDNVSEIETATWPQQKAYFDFAYSNTILLKSLLEGAIGYAEDETHNLIDFIQANLRKTIFTVPEKENEVQNGIEAMFVGRSMEKGTDYDRETGRVKTSGKESIPDFILPRLRLCLEVKLLKSAKELKSIVDEINADVRVYDLGVIRDEAEFKRDIENAQGVSVLIIKH
jgi:hypothetical protein